jgi:two-component system sensor histidine kinase ResE
MYANKAVDDRLNKGDTVIPEMRLIDLKVFDKVADLFRSDISAKKVQQVEIPGYGSFVVHSYPLAAEVEPGGKAYVFQDVTDYLAQASQRLDLISVVSQYFRTPLSLIQGYTSMMDMFGPLNDQQTSYLNKINQSIQRLNKAVEDILDFSRIESGDGLRISQIDAVQMVDQTVKDFQILADHRQVDLEFIRPREEQVILNADEALVQQALYNLIDNAVKFNRANGKVSVSVINDGSKVKFLVRDTGMGIAEVDQQYIFDRDHQRNKRGINDRRASGLGLSMVKAIMNWHNGDVFVSSVLGEGSEFTLVFPKKH